MTAGQRRLGVAQPEPLDGRRAADDEGVLDRDPAAAGGHGAVALVGGDDGVRGAVGAPLQQAHRPVHRVALLAEPREVELGHEVVLVEDDPGAAGLRAQRGEEQQVRRVAQVDHVDRRALLDALDQPVRVPEGGAVLLEVALRPPGGGHEGVAVDPDAVDDDLGLGVPLRPERADHLDLPAVAGEGLALLPDPPVERDREVLDDDQGSTRQGRHIPPVGDAPPRPGAGRGR